MKTKWLGGVFLLVLGIGSALAESEELRVMPAVVPAPAMVMQISIEDDDSRSAPKLRDVLRQPYGELQVTNNQPYRLSAEERHRMREQLRGQLAQHDGNKGKP